MEPNPKEIVDQDGDAQLTAEDMKQIADQLDLDDMKEVLLSQEVVEEKKDETAGEEAKMDQAQDKSEKIEEAKPAKPPIKNVELNKLLDEMEMPEDGVVQKLDDCNLLVHGKIKISIVHNDICKEKVGAITNAANSSLLHGGGVAGAISRNGGPDINK